MTTTKTVIVKNKPGFLQSIFNMVRKTKEKLKNEKYRDHINSTVTSIMEDYRTYIPTQQEQLRGNQMNKTGLNDNRLTWKAKGLLCYLTSLPDTGSICVNELKNHSSDGRDSTITALNELIKYGYITRKVSRDGKGLLKGYSYFIR